MKIERHRSAGVKKQKGNEMIELWDTFNNRIISRHRNLTNAVKAMTRHDRAVKRANGPNSYIPYAIREDGKDVDYVYEEERQRQQS